MKLVWGVITAFLIFGQTVSCQAYSVQKPAELLYSTGKPVASQEKAKEIVSEILADYLVKYASTKIAAYPELADDVDNNLILTELMRAEKITTDKYNPSVPELAAFLIQVPIINQTDEWKIVNNLPVRLVERCRDEERIMGDPPDCETEKQPSRTLHLSFWVTEKGDIYEAGILPIEPPGKISQIADGLKNSLSTKNVSKQQTIPAAILVVLGGSALIILLNQAKTKRR